MGYTHRVDSKRHAAHLASFGARDPQKQLLRRLQIEAETLQTHHMACERRNATLVSSHIKNGCSRTPWWRSVSCCCCCCCFRRGHSSSISKQPQQEQEQRKAWQQQQQQQQETDAQAGRSFSGEAVRALHEEGPHWDDVGAPAEPPDAAEVPRRYVSDDISRLWLVYRHSRARAGLWRSETAAAAAAAGTPHYVPHGEGMMIHRHTLGTTGGLHEEGLWGPWGGPGGLHDSNRHLLRYCSEAETFPSRQQQQQQQMPSGVFRAATSMDLSMPPPSKPRDIEGVLRAVLARLEADNSGDSLLDFSSATTPSGGGGGGGVGVAGTPGNGDDGEEILAAWNSVLRVLMLLGQICLAFCRYWLMPVLTSPAAFLAILVRTLAWCAVWLWATTYMERSGGSKGLLNWSFSSLPHSYSIVESLFVWMVTGDYCVGLMASPSPFAFVLSPHSIIDIVTLPVSAYFIRLVVADPRAHGYPWLLGLGWLRFLRLLRIETVLGTCFPTLSLVSLRVVSIGVSWLMIVLTFAGGIFILEAPDVEANYISVFDLCFYAVVTVMTVGYGDFAPETPAGRGLAMCVIVSAFAYLPGEIQRLMEALREPRKMYGTAPTQDEDYLCIVGPIQPQQLSAFCFEVGKAFPGSASALLCITPLPVAAYVESCQSALKHSGVRVCIRGGAKGVLLPSSIRSACTDARAVFVFSNSKPYSTTGSPPVGIGSRGSAEGPLLAAGSGESVETREQEEDQMTLLRFLGARAACFPLRPINVQLLHDHRKGLVTDMGAYATLCISELKMKLLGRSCASCPGFLPLVGCWFVFSKPHRRRPWRVPAVGRKAREDLQQYERGTGYTVYRMEFPHCVEGVSFLELARVLYVQYEVYLIGVISLTSKIAINPGQYTVGAETELAAAKGHTPGATAAAAYAGIVLAPNLEVVARLTSAKEIAARRRHKKAFAGLPQHHNRLHLLTDGMLCPLSVSFFVSLFECCCCCHSHLLSLVHVAWCPSVCLLLYLCLRISVSLYCCCDAPVSLSPFGVGVSTVPLPAFVVSVSLRGSAAPTSLTVSISIFFCVFIWRCLFICPPPSVSTCP